MVDCDVAIIGGGPGGYVAAIRAGQLGLNTVCIEMDKTLGGTCVNVGCIPSKALLSSSEHFEFARLHAAEHGVQVGEVKIPEVPKHLLVIGGGVIGLELGSVWRRLGAKVTVVELMPTILPGNDEEIIKEADKIFRKQGLEIRVGSKVTGAKVEANRVVVDVEKDGKSEKIEADYVLVSVGRKSSLNAIDAAVVGVNVSN